MGWGAPQVSFLGTQNLAPLLFAGWSRGGGETGALLFPLLSHCLHLFLLSPADTHSQTPPFSPPCCV